MAKHGSTGGSHHTPTGSHHTPTGSHHPSPGSKPHPSGGSPTHHESKKPNTGHGEGTHHIGTSAGGKGHRLNTESLGTMEGHIGRTRDKVDGVGRKVAGANFGHESMGVLGTGMTGTLNNTVEAAKAQVAKTTQSVDAAGARTKAARLGYETNEANTIDTLNKTGKDVKAPPVKEGSTAAAGASAATKPAGAGGSPPNDPPPGGGGPPSGDPPDGGGHGTGGGGPKSPGGTGPKPWRQSLEDHFTPSEMKELNTAFEKASGQPVKGQVPGSGQLTQRELDLVARAQGLVEIKPDTMMQKVIPPGALEKYLDNKKIADPRFDPSLVGGFVARAQDAGHLRTPADIVQGNRLDYVNTPYKDMSKPVHVMEFPAGSSTYQTPFGAPFGGGSGTHEKWNSVQDAANRMVTTAESQGLPESSYSRQVNRWPFTGIGMTADAGLGVPERYRPYDQIPRGSTIYEYDPAGNKTPVARYEGKKKGWVSVP